MSQIYIIGENFPAFQLHIVLNPLIIYIDIFSIDIDKNKSVDEYDLLLQKAVTLQLELSSAGDYYFILILKVLKVQSKNNDESHVSSGTEPLQKKRNFLLQESLKMLKTTCHYTKGKKIENTIKAKLTKDKEFKISKINLEKKKSVRKMKKIRGKETDTKDKEFKIKNTTKPTKDKEFKIKNTSKINLEKKKSLDFFGHVGNFASLALRFYVYS
ncbi:unnamed protein product [Rhizophagus irregularis]|nr:unnamed protein product [Rhizophagus irregularis]